MNNTNLFWWIGFYFGQECIIHPDTGRWILAGFFDGQVVCVKMYGEIQIDCMHYPIEEISFVLKFANPWLIKSIQKLPFFFSWVKSHAFDGYWVFDDKTVKVIYES